MAFQVTKEAENDVADLYEFGTLRYGLDAATRYALGLSERFYFLSQFPRSTRERHEVRPPVRVLPYGSHIIAYRVQNEDVLVIRVLHHRADWVNELSEN